MSEPPDAIQPPRSRSARTVLRPLQEFLQTSTSSAVLLFGALVVALVWANVGDSYASFWQMGAVLRIAGVEVGHDLRSWVNDGLMTISRSPCSSRSSPSRIAPSCSRRRRSPCSWGRRSRSCSARPCSAPDRRAPR